jgi:hypothetical protein
VDAAGARGSLAHARGSPGPGHAQAEQLVALLVEDILAQLHEDAGDSLRALAPGPRTELEAHVRQEAEDLRTLYFALRG